MGAQLGKNFFSKRPVYWTVILLLFLALIFSLLFAVTIGSSDIPFKDVYLLSFISSLESGMPLWAKEKYMMLSGLFDCRGWFWPLQSV